MIYRRALMIGVFLLAGILLLNISAPVRSQSDSDPWASYLAYSSLSWANMYAIRMDNMVTGQTHILTSSTIDSTSPFWAPDGVQMAFMRYGQIYLFDSAGQSSTEHEIENASAETNIAWNPDSTAFATSYGITDLASGTTQPWEIYPHPGYNLTWSGQLLMFDPPVYDITDEHSQILDLTTGLAHPTFEAEGVANTCCGVWSPDGKQIALFITTDTGIDQLVVFDLADPTVSRVLAELDRPEIGTSFPLAWSPDGLNLAYVNAQGLLYVVNLRGVPNPRYIDQHVSYARYGQQKFDWSPDGSQLAYIAQDTAIYVVDIAGSEPPRSIVRNEHILSLDWQPAQLKANNEAQVAVLDEEGLSLRAAPDINAEIVTKLANGTIVNVLGGPEASGGYQWWNLRTADGQEGWSVASADGIVTLLPRPATFSNLVYHPDPTSDPNLEVFGTSTWQPTAPVVLASLTVENQSCAVTIKEDTYLYHQPGGDENRDAAYLPAGSVVIVNGKAVIDGQNWWRWKDATNWLPDAKLYLTDGCATVPLVEY